MILNDRYPQLLRRWLLAAPLTLLLVFAGTGTIFASQATPGTDAALPSGAPLTSDELSALTDQFQDEVLTGGQVAPRISRWVNDDVFIFLQLDARDPAEATTIPYIGIGVKSVFCAETQPDPSFTHFHQYDAAEYAEGHGSAAGQQGYWLTWIATDAFAVRDGREVAPGIDYEFSPTPPPDCGTDIPEVSFAPPGAGPLSPKEISELASLFDSTILTGGQTPPRFHKWVNDRVSIFLQFDAADPAEATELHDIGITVTGEFCAENQPTADFPHFHQTEAAAYAEGHGSAPGQQGYWLLWVATTEFETRDGRQVTPGVDRDFSPTPAPTCGTGADGASTPVGSTDLNVTVTGSEFAFTPAEIRLPVGAAVIIAFDNVGTIPHTFTLPAVRADTGSVSAGASSTLRLETPSSPMRLEYLCTFGGHLEAGMVGTLIVE